VLRLEHGGDDRVDAGVGEDRVEDDFGEKLRVGGI
jgi:hypothetical protein